MTTNFDSLRAQLQEDRKRLLEEFEQLQASIPSSDERREGSPFGKREEEATEASELEKRLALEQRIRQELASIDHAVQKFEEGTYGSCDNCGQKIDPARLEALPQASLCLACKALQAKNARIKPPPGY